MLNINKFLKFEVRIHVSIKMTEEVPLNDNVFSVQFISMKKRNNDIQECCVITKDMTKSYDNATDVEMIQLD